MSCVRFRGGRGRVSVSLIITRWLALAWRGRGRLICKLYLVASCNQAMRRKTCEVKKGQDTMIRRGLVHVYSVASCHASRFAQDGWSQERTGHDEMKGAGLVNDMGMLIHGEGHRECIVFFCMCHRDGRGRASSESCVVRVPRVRAAARPSRQWVLRFKYHFHVPFYVHSFDQIIRCCVAPARVAA